MEATSEPDTPEHVRTAEIVAALCLATDLGMGFPFEHGLHGTLVTTRLCDRLGVDDAVATQAYYGSLLMYSGCTTDAATAAQTFGGSMTEHFVPVMFGTEREMLAGVLRAIPMPGRSPFARAADIARRLPAAGRERDPHLVAICEVGESIARRLGLPESVSSLFHHLTERWDGKGRLRRAAGEEVPLAIRIVQVSRDAALQHLLGGTDRVTDVIRSRAGHAFDPAIAGRLVDDADEIFEPIGDGSVWSEVLDHEPGRHLTLSGDEIDDALSAMADFGDLISPWLAGHSRGVAELTAAAGRRCRLSRAEQVRARRAALVHDLGRVAVHPRVWKHAGTLSADDWEQVRLHPYQTERILGRSEYLSSLAPLAAAHHECLDGSGYHRGMTAADQPVAARLVAAADAYHAMVEARPHRPAMSPEQAAEVLGLRADRGELDTEAVSAVLDAAGQDVPVMARPAELTAREVEVVRLAARGLLTKQIGRTLEISAKTADRHIQNAYRKLGVSTRAAATLLAMEHGLLSWGELPISRTEHQP